MTHFLDSASRLIHRHGIDVTITSVAVGTYDPATGSVTNTETTATIKSYPKGIKVNQFNYPNLIGKEVIEFLISASDAVPQVQDKITMGSKVYTVTSVQEIVAHGVSTLYKALAVK